MFERYRLLSYLIDIFTRFNNLLTFIGNHKILYFHIFSSILYLTTSKHCSMVLKNILFVLYLIRFKAVKTKIRPTHHSIR